MKQTSNIICVAVLGLFLAGCSTANTPKRHNQPHSAAFNLVTHWDVDMNPPEIAERTTDLLADLGLRDPSTSYSSDRRADAFYFTRTASTSSGHDIAVQGELRAENLTEVTLSTDMPARQHQLLLEKLKAVLVADPLESQ